MAGQPVPVVISGNTIGYYDESQSFTVQNDGLSIDGARVWTYSGSKIFDGFATNDHTQDVTYAVGYTGVLHSENLYNLWPIDHEQAPVEPSDLSISYKGSEIASLSSSGTKILKTAGKYMEDDVEVVYTRPEGTDVSDTTAAAADVLAPKIFHLSTGASAAGTIPTKSAADATVNQNVVTFPWGYYPSQVQKTVGIAQAAQTITPGSVNQVISSGRYLAGNQTILGDANLLSENIKSGVSIFGKMGTYGGEGYTIIDPLSIVANGTYVAPSGHAYSPVSVNIDTQIGWETAPESWATGLVDRTISGSVYGSMVLTIGSYTFYGCSALASVSFPSCTIIGSYAFYGCRTLTSVSFPSCTTIGYNAFFYCSALASVSFPACTSIGLYAFYSCTALASVSFPACTTIGSYAFGSCAALRSISFPMCTTIWTSAFYSCRTLASASFPVCTTIGNQVFASCSALRWISFPSCTTIGSSAFSSCTALDAVSFPACTTIGASAFYNCYALRSISFPACTTIGSYAFFSCRTLTSASFPECIKMFMYAFGYCSALRSISFPTCIIIWANAFVYCSALTSVSFPACTTIGHQAFDYCSRLSAAYFLASSLATLSSSNAFQYTPMQYSSYLGVFGSIYVPSSLVASYKAATNWTYYSERIVGV